MSEIATEKKTVGKETRLWRVLGYMKELKDLCEELETNDTNLVMHLLILDALRHKKRKHFTGVEITRAGKQRNYQRKK